MKLQPEQIEISEEKILYYLLAKKEKNDKSFFLEKLGFSVNNYKELIEEIRNIAVANEAVFSRNSDFGDLYKIEGILKSQLVITIWLEQIEVNKFRFVTLYPY